MEGILYVINDQNKKRFVQIDLDKYVGKVFQQVPFRGFRGKEVTS